MGDLNSFGCNMSGDWCLRPPCILQVLSLAKGFRGRGKNCIRVARERVEKALQYAYRDRKAKKRDMRSLWIQRVNAASKEHGVRSHTPVRHARKPPCLPHHILIPTHSMKLTPDFY